MDCFAPLAMTNKLSPKDLNMNNPVCSAAECGDERHNAQECEAQAENRITGIHSHDKKNEELKIKN